MVVGLLHYIDTGVESIHTHGYGSVCFDAIHRCFWSRNAKTWVTSAISPYLFGWGSLIDDFDSDRSNRA